MQPVHIIGQHEHSAPGLMLKGIVDSIAAVIADHCQDDVHFGFGVGGTFRQIAKRPERLQTHASMNDSKESGTAERSSKYSHWGGFVAVIFTLPDAHEALAADKTLTSLVQKLDSVDVVINARPRSFDALMAAVAACGFTPEDINRLNSPLLDGLSGISRRHHGRRTGEIAACAHKLTSTPRLVDVAMYDAIELRADITVLKILLDFGAEYEMLGAHMLLVACKVGDVPTVNFLLSLDPKRVNDVWGQFPVGVAAQRGNLPLVQALVAQGADIAINTYYAVQEAAKANHVSIVEFLLDAASKPMPPRPERDKYSRPGDPWVQKDAYIAALLGAFEGKHVDLVRKLLDGPFSLAELQPKAYSLVSYATGSASIEIVELLLDRGASLDALGGNAEYKAPLVRAVKRADGALEMCSFLVEKGAQITQKAMEAAIQEHHVDVIQYFLARGVQSTPGAARSVL